MRLLSEFGYKFLVVLNGYEARKVAVSALKEDFLDDLALLDLVVEASSNVI